MRVVLTRTPWSHTALSDRLLFSMLSICCLFFSRDARMSALATLLAMEVDDVTDDQQQYDIMVDVLTSTMKLARESDQCATSMNAFGTSNCHAG